MKSFYLPTKRMPSRCLIRLYTCCNLIGLMVTLVAMLDGMYDKGILAGVCCCVNAGAMWLVSQHQFMSTCLTVMGSHQSEPARQKTTAHHCRRRHIHLQQVHLSEKMFGIHGRVDANVIECCLHIWRQRCVIQLYYVGQMLRFVVGLCKVTALLWTAHIPSKSYNATHVRMRSNTHMYTHALQTHRRGKVNRNKRLISAIVDVRASFCLGNLTAQWQQSCARIRLFVLIAAFVCFGLLRFVFDYCRAFYSGAIPIRRNMSAEIQTRLQRGG